MQRLENHLPKSTHIGSSFFDASNMTYMYKRNRPDKDGKHRAAFDKNKKRIYATQTICALCGRPVDFSLRFPDPMSPTVDHIIPIAKGGHPSDIENLQLAHLACNRKKSDKSVKFVFKADETINNRTLPQSMDWKNYHAK